MQPPVGLDEMTGIAIWIRLQVILMLRLSLPEVFNRFNLGSHLSRPDPGGVDIRDGIFRNLLLFFGCVEDGRAIACSNVIALAIQRGRVVDLKEKLQ